LGAYLFVQTLARLTEIVPEKQDNALATYAPLLKKEDGRIDWTRDAQAIHCQVRGLQPWPGASTSFRRQAMHIWKSRVWSGTAGGSTAGLAGSIASVKPPVVNCGAGGLELVEVQLEGRKRMPAADFANGQHLTENESLGEPLA
jgi:methionyl-tRNA formyltransferase